MIQRPRLLEWTNLNSTTKKIQRGTSGFRNNSGSAEPPFSIVLQIPRPNTIFQALRLRSDGKIRE